jgi:TonB family protein
MKIAQTSPLLSRLAVFATLIFFVSPSVAVEDTKNSSSTYDFPLGLERLHWGMSIAEVRQTLPSLNFEPDPCGPIKTAGELVIRGLLCSKGDDKIWVAAGHENAGCSLNLRMKLYRDRLFGITIWNDSGSCRQQIEQAISTRYGAVSNGKLTWNGHGTGGNYTGGTGLSVIDLGTSCQSITVDFVPRQNSDGAANPVLTSDVSELGCGYPPVSVRLLEEGTVGVTLTVLADGTVSNPMIALASPHPRLDAGALDIVQKKIRFTPAIKDGKPTAVEQRITLTFTVLYPVRGTQ